MNNLPFAIAILVVLALLHASMAITCHSPCKQDSDCMADITNPCTFCFKGNCTTMCGVGCRSNSDCQGGSNPCTLCNEMRVCSNPIPKCGTFCGGVDLACRYNGTGPCAGVDQQCCMCHPTNLAKGCGNWGDQCGNSCSINSDCASQAGNCTTCYQNRCINPPKCGDICTSSSQCTANPTCPQCVGYFCSPKASCGQNCLSSGQCQSNPGNCKACIGTVCQNYAPCGGACGGDDWCPSTCPVCYFAKCTKRSALALLSANETIGTTGIVNINP